MTKTAQAASLAKQGKWKEALRIYKTFRHEFSRDEKRVVEIAYECLAGKSGFYAQLGINAAAIVAQAQQLLTQKYL